MRRWLLMVVVMGLVGCTTLSDTRKAAIRNVAVVSAIGDDVTLFRVLGFEGLKPEQVDWSFDKIATDAVVAAVQGQNPAVTIVPVDYDSNALAADIHRYASFESYADPARIAPALRQMTAGKSVDTIVVVARNSSDNGALMTWKGVGIMTELSAQKGAPITPFANLALFVLDGSTLQVLAQQTKLTKGALYNLNPILEFGPIGGPAPFLPGFKFPMTEEQKTFLRPVLQDVLRIGTQGLMRDTGF